MEISIVKPNTAAERAAAGIPEGLVRYSIGIEGLLTDLEQVLAYLK